jgi:hypothetical protein
VPAPIRRRKRPATRGRQDPSGASSSDERPHPLPLRSQPRRPPRSAPTPSPPPVGVGQLWRRRAVSDAWPAGRRRRGQAHVCRPGVSRTRLCEGADRGVGGHCARPRTPRHAARQHVPDLADLSGRGTIARSRTTTTTPTSMSGARSASDRPEADRVPLTICDHIHTP